MVHLDDVLQELGSCGLFQILLVLAVVSMKVCAVWGSLFMVFGSYDPGWVCLDGLDHNTSDSFNSSNITQLYGVEKYFFEKPALNKTSRCQEFKECRNVVFHPGSSTVVSEWGLVCDQDWIPSVIFTIQVFGVMVGAYIAGQLGDCVGRRTCLYGMLTLYAVGNIAAMFSPAWEVLATIMFFIGIAVGGILTTTSTVPIEFLNQFWRGIAGSIPMWNIGAATFSLMVWVLKDWRQLHLLIGVVSGLFCFSMIWVPESLRWLVVHGRDNEAEVVATRISRINRKPAPSSNLLKSFTEFEKKVEGQSSSRRYSYIDLFRDPTIRKTSILMGIVWVLVAVVYYGISFGIQALSGDFYVNFLLFSLMELPACVFVCLSLSLLGRRWASAGHFLVVSISCFAVLPVTLLLQSSGNDDDTKEEMEDLKDKIVMGLALVSKVLVINVWCVTIVFSGELFPTVVRNLGYGYINAAARIGAMLGPLLFPRDPELLHIGFTVVGVLMLLCMLFMLVLPETKGRALEDRLRTMTITISIADVDYCHEHDGVDTSIGVDYFHKHDDGDKSIGVQSFGVMEGNLCNN